MQDKPTDDTSLSTLPTPAAQPVGHSPTEVDEPLDSFFNWESDTPQYRRRRLPAIVVIVLLVLVDLGLAYFATRGDGAGAGTTVETPSGGDKSSLGALTTPGIRSMVTLSKRPTITVSDQILLAQPGSAVTLTLPEPADDTVAGQFDPRVTDLHVVVDGEDRLVTENLAPGDNVTVPVPPGTVSLTVDYVARGAVIASEPSEKGRGLALVDALKIEGQSGLRRTLLLNGGGVTNAGCLSSDATLSSCGEEATAGWKVVLKPRDKVTDVVAQVNVPD